MAHNSHSIPWKVLASNFEYVAVNHNYDDITNLYPRFKDSQGKEISYFVQAFARAVQEHSSNERKKYPQHYDPPDLNEIIVSDDTVRRIGATVSRWCARAFEFPTKPPQDTQALTAARRRVSAFLIQLSTNNWRHIYLDKESFYNFELLKTLVLYGEMDPVFKICAHPDNDLLSFWVQNRNFYTDRDDIGWEHIPKMAFKAYLCLNLLYCYPELWDEKSGRHAGNDYRSTKAYQQTLRECTFSGRVSRLACYPHMQFFGIPESHFSRYPRARKGGKYAYTFPSSAHYPYGKMPIADFLKFEHLMPRMDSPSDVNSVHWMLRSQGLPTEIVLYVMELAEYFPSRRLEVEHDPLHPDNQEDLMKYLSYCWQLLLRCDMMAKELGDQIPWDVLVSDCLVLLVGTDYKNHKRTRHNKRKMYEFEVNRDGTRLSMHEWQRYLFI
ncbi:hypothetical protein NM208_g1776 [Fusarium decemcellulare]|uniref:Uncharacterized protein n=2 Tax=Fusarium decemcellulare TaxID=57161 RepID=A0ACC1SUP3_9HYPO|nr:hypothetical protein NM208_g1884 [Fusarium decemcellulare]KAJ3546891.1 hypothetical protein NM208_g1776 [Fusarium decemcellulare]